MREPELSQEEEGEEMEGERRRKHCRISRPLINKLTKANLDINKDRQLKPREPEAEERKRERGNFGILGKKMNELRAIPI